MKAMILAAGRGERMRPLTDHCPKPLLQAGGKPLIEWHLDALKCAGIQDIVINHAHLGQQIEDYFQDGTRLGVHIQYSAETVALETAGGIRQALPFLGDQPFLVINGDVACDWSFQKALALATAWPPGLLAHLVLVPNPAHNPGGDFALHGNQVRLSTDQSPAFTFSGMGVYHPSLFDPVEAGTVAKLAPLLREAMAAGKVQGELFEGFWMDIGTPERLEELDNRLNSARKQSV